MLSEKNILKTLSADPHPFIVNLAATFQDPRYLFMVLEYIVGGGEGDRSENLMDPLPQRRAKLQAWRAK